MAVSSLQVVDIIEVMENFLEKIRPPEEMRKKLDISYRIEGQSVVIFEVRPKLSDPQKIHESPVAKATYVKSTDNWKVYWMRANLKWVYYEPLPLVKTLKDFTIEVDKDSHGCFWG